MKGSNFEDIVDRIRLQYSLYQLEKILKSINRETKKKQEVRITLKC